MCRLPFTVDGAENLLADFNSDWAHANASDIAPVASRDPCAQFQTGYRDGLNEFSSPNFPDKYSPNLDCVRVIQAPPGYDIEAAYEEEKDSVAANSTTMLNCPNDYLEVRDGRYPFSALLVRLCGRKIPSFEIRARSGFCWLHFHTDNLLEYNGFIASHEFLRSNNAMPYQPVLVFSKLSQL
uniref:CUB domain-containing protein n=1 Tax=Ditylenchus dipsaci TaxID=166011 RepID=A0A915D8G8_9BILA